MGARMTNPNRGRRGITLLEVLVAIGTAAVIFGIAMGILITTNQTANQGIAHESLLQQAEVAMRSIRSVIEATVWPDDVAGTSPSAPLVFTREGLGLFSSHQSAGAGLICRHEFVNAPGAGEKGTTRTAAQYNCYASGSVQKPASRLVGERFDSHIGFRYATQVGADLQPVWQENLPAGQRPRLIWVELILRDPARVKREGKVEEVRLTTAISL